MSIFSPQGSEPTERPASIKAAEGVSITEAICAAAAVVLAILGLAGLLPRFLASISAIVLGVALLAQGGAVAARHSALMHEEGFEGHMHAEVGSGMGAEVLAGGAAIVLGILGLIGLATGSLLAIAAIALGAGLLLGGGATSSTSVPGHARSFAAASGMQALVGAGAVVLGIIALIGRDRVTIDLVAFLVIGAGALLTSGAVAGILARRAGHHH